MDRLGFHGTISEFFAKLKNNSSFIIDDPVSTDVLRGHSKEDQKLFFKTDYLLMQVKSITECFPLEHSVILLTCISDNRSLRPLFCLF